MEIAVSARGFIQIAGAWEGAVVCIGSEALVRRAAAVMFGIPAEALTVELLHDAFGELTNMVGGNLKALLPGPSFLCLPAVVEGANYSVCIPAARPVLDVGFLSDGQPFNVKILAGGVRPDNLDGVRKSLAGGVIAG